MTSLASVVLSGAKNLNSCRATVRKPQTDPLPIAQVKYRSNAGLPGAPSLGVIFPRKHGETGNRENPHEVALSRHDGVMSAG